MSVVLLFPTIGSHKARSRKAQPPARLTSWLVVLSFSCFLPGFEHFIGARMVFDGAIMTKKIDRPFDLHSIFSVRKAQRIHY